MRVGGFAVAAGEPTGAEASTEPTLRLVTEVPEPGTAADPQPDARIIPLSRTRGSLVFAF